MRYFCQFPITKKLNIMEDCTSIKNPPEGKCQDKAITSNWRSDERRTDNHILSVLLRNAERKHKLELANRPLQSNSDT